jgi:hypothetical protein
MKNNSKIKMIINNFKIIQIKIKVKIKLEVIRELM